MPACYCAPCSFRQNNTISRRLGLTESVIPNRLYLKAAFDIAFFNLDFR